MRFLLRFGLILAVVTGLAYVAYRQLGYPGIGLDDANIFMVYGRNLAHGNGLVYNAGGPRVEGFTSLLYVLVLGALFVISDNPERLILGFNLVVIAFSLSVFTVVLDRAASRADRTAPRLSFASLLFLIWTLCTPAYMAWTTVTLMDTGLWAGLLLLFVGALVLTDDSRGRVRRWPACLLAALCVPARPESMLWVPAILGAAGAAEYARRRSVLAALRLVVPMLLAFAATLAALTTFRLLYFGYPLPNTYYAKVSPSLAHNAREGFDYLRSFLAQQPCVWLCLLAALACVASMLKACFAKRVDAGDRPALRSLGETEMPDTGSRIPDAGLPCVALAKRGDRLMFVVCGALAIGLLSPLLTGGDHFAWYRFLQPVWPLLIVPVWLIGRRSLDGGAWAKRPAMGIAALTAVAVICVGSARPSWLARGEATLTTDARLAYAGREVGREMASLLGPGDLPSVGVTAAGGIKMTYPGETVDLMGLNDARMGHSPGTREGPRNHAAFSKDVFFQIKPDLALPVWRDDLPADNPLVRTWYARILKGLPDDARFAAEYQPIAVTRSGSNGEGWLIAYARWALIDRLVARPDITIRYWQAGGRVWSGEAEIKAR